MPWIGFFFSDLVEALENLLLLFFGNPNAKILDAYDGIVLVFCDVYNTRSACGECLSLVLHRKRA